jgi:O-antigen/teichoic acid export membrane protein
VFPALRSLVLLGWTRFGSGAVLVLCGRLIQLGLYFVVARQLDVSTVGAFVSALALGQMTGVFATLGLGAAAQKRIPRALEVADFGAVSTVVSRSCRALATSCLVAVGILGGLLAYQSTSGFSFLSTGQLVAALAYVPVLWISAHREMLSRAFGRTVLALAPRDVIWSALFCACVSFADFSPTSFLLIGAGLLLLIEALSCAVLFVRDLAPVYSQARNFAVESASDERSDGLAFAASSFGGLAFERIDTLFVSLTMGSALAGVYGVSGRVAPVASMSQRFIVPVLINSFARAHASGRSQELRGQLAFGTLVSLLCASPTMLLVFICGEQLLGWFGPAYHEGLPVLKALVVAHCAIAFGSCSGALVLAGPAPWLYVRAIWTALGLFGLLCWILEPSTLEQVAFCTATGIVSYNVGLVIVAVMTLPRRGGEICAEIV